MGECGGTMSPTFGNSGVQEGGGPMKMIFANNLRVESSLFDIIAVGRLNRFMQ